MVLIDAVILEAVQGALCMLDVLVASCTMLEAVEGVGYVLEPLEAMRCVR